MILTPDNEYSVVLDACVLVPMALCDTLLRLAEEPSLFRLIWSTRILEELERNLIHKLGRTAEQAAYRVREMRKAFPEAEIPVPSELLDAFDDLPDDGDRHVLSAAVRGHANAIVTQNTKHFPVECLERFDILCQTPDDVLVDQFHLNPYQVLNKLDEQAAAIRLERGSVIDALSKVVPQFSKLCREYEK